MLYRITLGILCIGMMCLIGCRTGEYKADLEIYERMPGILAADPELENMLFLNEDGSVKVLFEKGEMHLWTAYGLDESTRQRVVGRAFELFHNEYINSTLNKRNDGSYYRQKIIFRGFIDDTELYVIEWDLDEENPNVVSNRVGNFM